MRSIIVAISFFLSFFTVSSQQTDNLFESANQLYNDGKYQEAINNYLKIIENGEHSASLYFNLGNAYYKLNRVAPSIYYYEKALQLSPNDSDITNNLLYAQNMTVDAIEVLPQTGFSKILQGLIGKVSYNTWAITSILCMLLFVITFLVYYFSSYQNKKRLFFIISITSLLFSLLSLIFAFTGYNYVNSKKPAIVFAKETGVNAEPNHRSNEIFVLHEGTKVNVEEEMGEWKKIKLADGKTGWLPSTEIKEIKDF
ncbi:tetratricopeptide repeat protein [Abyssalbus ytuae]|uniref:Tetratricopeptide repeat protein n=1 Tax=Abyssalbus ytuae TaxID=2926907 RepID=A0A9E6ZRM8_9FLAO|nr:tetratricopeptide repeat protein [Abyssalbus ytuae]UOB19220.1 tetratricopeptide repeat protein [Abyssalbus ytuae]